MDSHTTGLGVIGCGARSGHVVANVLKEAAGIKVRALCDPSTDSIAAIRAQVGRDPREYADYRDLVRDPTVDWVLVGSWNCFHREHAVAALEAGKDVFCEKPLATTLEDCVAIRDAVALSGRRFVIGFVLRYSPHYLKVKELIDTGTIGRIVGMEFNETIGFNHGGFIHSDWRRRRQWAGTHLLEKCCHDIDLANWFVGSVPRRVASFAGLNFFTPDNEYHVGRLGKDDKGRDAYRTWPSTTGLCPFTADKDIVDNQVAIMEYECGTRATFHTNCNAAIPERRMYILGTEGAIRADVLSGQLQVQRIGHAWKRDDTSGKAWGGHGGADEVMARRLADAMVNSAAMDTGIDDALRAAVACFGIDEAADTGTVVDMDPLWQRSGVTMDRPVSAPSDLAPVRA